MKVEQNYPQRDFHTMYVGKIEKVLVRDDEYLEYNSHITSWATYC